MPLKIREQFLSTTGKIRGLAFLMTVSTLIVLGKILYVGTAILQRKEDPKFEGDKAIYRS